MMKIDLCFRYRQAPAARRMIAAALAGAISFVSIRDLRSERMNGINGLRAAVVPTVAVDTRDTPVPFVRTPEFPATGAIA
jgi:hypothetical protein